MAIDIGRQAYLQLRGSIELVLLDAGIDSPDLLSQVMREVLATESLLELSGNICAGPS
ncbi:hypothetical protein [Pseudomonas aeruginosa]|uniref:hypothetical protein n=1 Tax=Pseudomonas aeruginosa TaxID=287 RepID=UPI0012FD83B9|nr:hypothetical protein [Pseudomonas aeruginosa]